MGGGDDGGRWQRSGAEGGIANDLDKRHTMTRDAAAAAATTERLRVEPQQLRGMWSAAGVSSGLNDGAGSHRWGDHASSNGHFLYPVLAVLFLHPKRYYVTCGSWWS